MADTTIQLKAGGWIWSTAAFSVWRAVHRAKIKLNWGVSVPFDAGSADGFIYWQRFDSSAKTATNKLPLRGSKDQMRCPFTCSMLLGQNSGFGLL